MTQDDRVSESIRLGTMLTLTGGFLDAYSYVARGGVFANAETGNVARMGISLANGNIRGVFYYLVPVVSFALGVSVAIWLQRRLGEHPKVHWKEGILWAEILVIFLVGWIPQEANSVVHAMIAFTCAMQVETFRKLRGKVFSTTMCTGNLRSGTELIVQGNMEGDQKKARSGLQYYWIDFVFILGAALGTIVTRQYGDKAIWFCLITLFLAIGFIEHQKKSARV